ncbi:BNR-4 repeat-containing protein, partial [bacterium]|nr:BNR-4 repeat-containing protein [bacterium]
MIRTRMFHHCIVSLFILLILPTCLFAQDGWTPSDGIQFNGSNQYIQIDSLNGFNGDEFTLEAWIKLNHNDGSQIFINRGAASEDFTFYLYNGKIRMLAQDASGYSHANADPPPAGEWFHCVGVFDNGTKRLYYNGELKASASGPFRSVQNGSPLTIGALLNGFAAERFLDGQMENIRIWNRALPQQEIAALAKADPSDDNVTVLRENGVIAYWAARSLQGEILQDLSGNSNQGKWIESEPDEIIVETVPAEGYQGIWYSNQPSDDKYRYKYSGGLGTYCAKHRHHAQYAPEVNKTFFVYGGTKGFREQNALLMMISYYDHETNQLARPVMVQEKGTSDAHHNPVLEIDPQGHLWIFASAHGGKDGFIWRSTKPYSIDEFELIEQKEFTYPQPRYVPDFGFVFLFTKYTGGREMYINTSPDGLTWGADKKICGFGGHY